MNRKMNSAVAACLCLTIVAVMAAACEGDGAFEPSILVATPTATAYEPLPGFTPSPTITVEPAVTMEPTIAMAPTVALQPTVALEPTITTEPTVALQPTVVLQPTVDMMTGFAPPDPTEGVGDVQEVLVGGRVFRLEVARSSAERARGLMNRPSLPRDAAMLFVFPEEAHRSFWMKNTLIPLDILYLDSSGVVVDVQTMTPQPGVPDSELTRYPSAAPARYAIEMNAGLAQEHGIQPGAQVLFR